MQEMRINISNKFIPKGMSWITVPLPHGPPITTIFYKIYLPTINILHHFNAVLMDKENQRRKWIGFIDNEQYYVNII